MVLRRTMDLIEHLQVQNYCVLKIAYFLLALILKMVFKTETFESSEATLIILIIRLIKCFHERKFEELLNSTMMRGDEFCSFLNIIASNFLRISLRYTICIRIRFGESFTIDLVSSKRSHNSISKRSENICIEKFNFFLLFSHFRDSPVRFYNQFSLPHR